MTKFRALLNSKVTLKVSKKNVCDHLTEIYTFRWVTAAYQCYKLFDLGQLALHYIVQNSSVLFSPPPEILMTQRVSFPPTMDDPDRQ